MGFYPNTVKRTWLMLALTALAILLGTSSVPAKASAQRQATEPSVKLAGTQHAPLAAPTCKTFTQQMPFFWSYSTSPGQWVYAGSAYTLSYNLYYCFDGVQVWFTQSPNAFAYSSKFNASPSFCRGSYSTVGSRLSNVYVDCNTRITNYSGYGTRVYSSWQTPGAGEYYGDREARDKHFTLRIAANGCIYHSGIGYSASIACP